MSTAVHAAGAPAASSSARLPRWWPLAALTLLAAVLRLSTLGLQSFWYDEAFTPVHVLHPSLWATLRGMVHTENSPPLWYLLAWADSRVLGTGEVALRLPSALAGIAAVPVCWLIGRELAGRRAAVACAALVAVNPLFVWYSQEARVYELFVLTSALAMLCFVRAEREPTAGRMAAFALTGALALVTHYFAVFLLIPMALWLLCQRRVRRAALPAIGGLALVGLALLPLVSAQGGHGTQWIGRWPLSERLQAIPQYYLTGHRVRRSGTASSCSSRCRSSPGWRSACGACSIARSRPPRARARAGAARTRGALMSATVAAGGVLIPIVLIAFGADYLAPRNLVGAMVPVTALIAIVLVTPGGGTRGRDACWSLIGARVPGDHIDVDLSPRLQRGDWRGVARALRAPGAERAITTVELGVGSAGVLPAAPTQPAQGTIVRVREIDETGYAPLRPRAGEPPAAGFRLARRDWTSTA